MIVLYQFPPAFELLNASPFCMKVELYLKLAKIPYQIISVRNPAKAPKGKLPFILDSETNQKIADSSIILDYLDKKFNAPLQQHLSEVDKANTLFIQRMLDEHYYWVMLYSRWVDEQGYAKTLPAFFGEKRNIIVSLLARKVRKAMIKAVYQQGLGRHQAEEVYNFGMQDLKALEIFLQGKRFAFGDEVSNLDTIIYAYLANTFDVAVESALKKSFEHSAILKKYCENMKTLLLQT